RRGRAATASYDRALDGAAPRSSLSNRSGSAAIGGPAPISRRAISTAGSSGSPVGRGGRSHSPAKPTAANTANTVANRSTGRGGHANREDVTAAWTDGSTVVRLTCPHYERPRPGSRRLRLAG